MQNFLTVFTDVWSSRLQASLLLTIMISLLWVYREFVPAFYRFAARFPGLVALMAVLYLMISGLLGSSFGIDYLFWHDDFLVRSFSSSGATLFLALLGVIAFYLDPHPWATAAKTCDFLKAEEEVKRRVEAWYARWLSKSPTQRIDAVPVPLKRRDYTIFALNAVLDPVAITPAQAWLDVDLPHALRLQRFLRAARGPFLLLLLAPAALPGAFPSVPHAAPTGMLGPFFGRDREPPNLDVTHSIQGYLIGLAAWLLGIQVGVIIIKIFIRCSQPLHRVRFTQSVVRLGHRVSALLSQVVIRFRNEYLPSGASKLVRQGTAQLREHAGVLEASGNLSPGGVREPESVHHDGCQFDSCPGENCPRKEPSYHRADRVSCQAQDEIRAAVLVFSGLFLGTFVVLGLVRWLREIHFLPDLIFGYPLLDIPPAFAICLIMAVLAMGYAGVASLTRPSQLAVVLVLVAWFGVANMPAFKYRFENLSYETQNIAPLRDRVIDAYDTSPNQRSEVMNPVGDRTKLISDNEALNKWKQAALADPDRPDVDSEGRPKLVLVATSGGATRSAYWTAVVLDRLEKELGPSFAHRIRIVCGASGGMLGAACYVDYRRAVAEKMERGGFDANRREVVGRLPGERGGASDPAPGRAPATLLPDWIRDGLPKRSLEPLARGIALAEIWKSAWPWTVINDRGVVLERDWGRLRYPIRCLAPLEAEGRIPSLIFSPMIVEDGRRLLISNLELGRNGDGWAESELVEARGRPIHRDEFPPGSLPNNGTEHNRYSLSSLEYFRIFPTSAHRDLMLSTAVRMSASFPFVSPAVNLPTDPPRRVVDAGYYDNYGIQVATSWIRRNKRWLMENTSGILLVQIRDSSSIASRLGVDDSRPGWLATFARGFQFFTSPVDAIGKAREATASFRNDADVDSLNSYDWKFNNAAGPNGPSNPDSFFTTVIFENSAEVSIDPGDFWNELTGLWQGHPARRDFREVAMSWYLTRAEMDATCSAIPGNPPERVHEVRSPADRPVLDWRDSEERWRMQAWLNGRINALDHPPSAGNDQSTAPDSDRALCRKRMDQLANFERLVNLKKWWTRPTH